LVEWWNASTNANVIGQALNDDSTDYTSATWSAATAFVEGGDGYETETLSRSAAPSSGALALAGSTVDGQLCDQYWISRGYTWNTVSVTNLAAFVHAPTNFAYSVHVANEELLRYDWSAVQCSTLETGDATGSFVTTARHGDAGFPDWSGDPVVVSGPHDNSDYVASTGRSRRVVRLFAVLEWEFDYDDD
jgi:hypothetical protein